MALSFVNLYVDALMSRPHGNWFWNDETNGLEFVSFVPQGSTKDKVSWHKVKASMELQSIVYDRSAGSLAQRSLETLKLIMSNAPRSSTFVGTRRRLLRLAFRERHEVTFEDVKNAAMILIQESFSMDIPESFKGIFGSQYLNNFLYSFIQYFAAYFDKKALLSKSLSLSTYPTITESQEVIEAQQRQHLAQRQIAVNYSMLLLGIGTCEQHHLSCGKKIESSSYSDKKLFECLYMFCSTMVWVTFRRTNLELIVEEVGRLLRSKTFNPVPKPQYSTIRFMEDPVLTKNITPGVFRQQNPKRPAIKSIIHQRSTIIIALLPSPKERTTELYRASAEQQKEPQKSGTKSIPADTFPTRVGIIGEPLSNFTPMRLIPLGQKDVKEAEQERQDESQMIRNSSSSFLAISQASHSKKGSKTNELWITQ